MSTIANRLRQIADWLNADSVQRDKSALHAIAAELEAPAADAQMPAYGSVPWDALIEAVCEAQTGNPKVGWERDQSYYIGHQPVSFNMNSLNRIVSKFVASAQVCINALEAQQNAIEHALYVLVNRCNADAFLATDDAVIHAEATLERLYVARRLASSSPQPSASIVDEARGVLHEPLVRQRDHLASVAALQARIKALEAENFTLAAGQCIVSGGLCGGEGGTPYCSLQRAASNAPPST